MMKLFEHLYNHSHHWGVPHRPFRDSLLLQTCYECGAQRKVKVSFPYTGNVEATKTFSHNKKSA